MAETFMIQIKKNKLDPFLKKKKINKHLVIFMKLHKFQLKATPTSAGPLQANFKLLCWYI